MCEKSNKVQHDRAELGLEATAPSALSVVVGGLVAPAPLEHLVSFLEAEELVRAIPASRFFAAVVASDAVWGEKCRILWQDKVFVPETFCETGPGGFTRIAAYWGSLADSDRTAITVKELCGLEWSTRMKGWAGDEWTFNDAWWRGKPAAKKRYNTDGSIDSIHGRGNWRFVPDSSGKRGPEGTFIRHSREGRDFPTHFVSRYNRNWGWIMQNCWGFSASFPLPPKGVEPELEDSGAICQSVTVDSCRDEAMRYNMGLPLPHEERPERDEGSQGGYVTVLLNGAQERLPYTMVAALISASQHGREDFNDVEFAEDGADEEDDCEEEDL